MISLECDAALKWVKSEQEIFKYSLSMSMESQICQKVRQCIRDIRPGDEHHRLNALLWEETNGCYSMTEDDTWIVSVRPKHTACSNPAAAVTTINLHCVPVMLSVSTNCQNKNSNTQTTERRHVQIHTPQPENHRTWKLTQHSKVIETPQKTKSQNSLTNCSNNYLLYKEYLAI